MSGRLNGLAVDGSETSARAFNWYIQNYHTPNDKILLMHVQSAPQLPSMGLSDGYIDPDHFRESIENGIKESRCVLEKFEALCQENNVNYSSVLLDDFHSAGYSICVLAKKHNVEAIIMGQRGRSPIKRVIFGSTSDYVLHHAHVPVIVVPPPPDDGHSK